MSYCRIASKIVRHGNQIVFTVHMCLMKSFIILEHEPLTVRLKKIWNIDALKAQGVHVEYWDLSQYIFPKAVIPQIVEDACVKRIKDLTTFDLLLSQVGVTRSVFVLEIYPNWDNRALILLLHKYHCRCVKIDLYANTMLPCSFFENVLSKLNNFTFRKLFKKLAWNCLLHRHSIRIYEKVLSSSMLVNPDIHINHPDYEDYLLLDKAQLNIAEKYILFIDNYYPLHPDIKNMYPSVAVNAEDYWQLMRSFFDYLEHKFQIKVVIAAHPKAVYTGREFDGRKILRGQTANLIKHADKVVMHGSNSLSYIALADKSFAIVYPDSYKRYPYLYKHVKDMAAYCRKEAYDLTSCNWDVIEFRKLNEVWRNNYISTFLASEETADKRNVDIWVDKLLKEDTNLRMH